MHLAVPITAHLLPVSPATGNVQGNSRSAALHFGDLVREGAGPVQVSVREAAGAMNGKIGLPSDSELQLQFELNSGANSEMKTDQPSIARPQAEPPGFSSVRVPPQAETRSISAHLSLPRSAESVALSAGNSKQTDSSVPMAADSKPRAMDSTLLSKTASPERKTREDSRAPGQIAAVPVSSAEQPSSLVAIATAPMQVPVRPIAAAGILPVSSTPPAKVIDPAALTVKSDMAAQATDDPSASGDRPAAQSTTSAPKPAGQPSTSSGPPAPARADSALAISSPSHSPASDPITPFTHGAGAAEQTHAGAGTASLATPLPANPHLLDSGVAASVHAGQPTPAANSSTASSAVPAPAAPNLYDKIEQGSTPVLLHSGAQHVAVGVRDPNLGWVEIKAQNTAGRVDTTLLTPSSQTHTSLTAQLPAMAQYLVQRDVRVGSLVVHHQSPGVSPDGNGANAQTHSDSGNAANQGRERPSSTRPSPGRFLSTPASASGEDSPLFRPVSYISVRA